MRDANDPLNHTDPDGKVFKLVTTAVKVIAKGGDVASTVSGIADNVRTIASPDATLAEKGLALAELALDVATGINSKDISAARNAIEGVSGDAGKGGASLQKQAADLIPMNDGKSRVTLRSEGQKMEVDLAGRDHRGIATPHTKISPRNTEAPAHKQPVYNTSEEKSTTRAATQQDIRTVRRYLEKMAK